MLDPQYRISSFNVGLAGEVQNRARAIERAVRELDSDRLNAGQLAIRRHEKNYFLRGLESDIQNTRDAVSRFCDLVDQSDEPAAEKQLLRMLSDQYLKAFDDYLAIDLARMQHEIRTPIDGVIGHC